jgi:thiol-disulfide isomerase/thioredoxin
LRGKYVLLDFWATWCVPCHRQSSDLEKVLQQFGGLKLAVLGINDEPVETTRSYLKNRSQQYPWLIDLGGRVGSLFDVKVLPTLVLLDPSGKVILKREQRQNFGQIMRLLNDAGLR